MMAAFGDHDATSIVVKIVEGPSSCVRIHIRDLLANYKPDTETSFFLKNKSKLSTVQ